MLNPRKYGSISKVTLTVQVSNSQNWIGTCSFVNFLLKFFINFCARRYCAPAYLRFIFWIKSAHYTRENTVINIASRYLYVYTRSKAKSLTIIELSRTMIFLVSAMICLVLSDSTQGNLLCKMLKSLNIYQNAGVCNQQILDKSKMRYQQYIK